MGANNAMRWDCEKSGCFNDAHRLKFDVFADCFPGKMNFSDVDAIIEIDRRVLMLEWKTIADIPTGQRIMYERMTVDTPITVYVVVGDARDMSVEQVGIYKDGQFNGWYPCTLEKLKEGIKVWAQDA